MGCEAGRRRSGWKRQGLSHRGDDTTVDGADNADVLASDLISCLVLLNVIGLIDDERKGTNGRALRKPVLRG